VNAEICELHPVGEPGNNAGVMSENFGYNSEQGEKSSRIVSGVFLLASGEC